MKDIYYILRVEYICAGCIKIYGIWWGFLVKWSIITDKESCIRNNKL
jgi:hypothetical protein